MEKILLVATNTELRQLYHELLFSLNCEVVPTASVSNAVMLLTIDSFNTIVLYVDNDFLVVETFLGLRKKCESWTKTRVVLLTTNTQVATGELFPNDLVLNTDTLSPQEVIDQIHTIH